MDISMQNVTQIVQKVRQANWRVQRQWITLFLLGLVAVSMVAGIYLNVTVRATLAGREVQLLEPTLSSDRRKNSDLETQLAGLTSVQTMHKRAESLGYRPADPQDFIYVSVPGYTPKAGVDMSQLVQVIPNQSERIVIQPEYTESLFDWITRALTASAARVGQP